MIVVYILYCLYSCAKTQEYDFFPTGEQITDNILDVAPDNIIKSKGFEADHEITAKLIKQGFKITEVPIDYKPRNKLEGKKINFFDGIKALITIMKYRFVN